MSRLSKRAQRARSLIAAAALSVLGCDPDGLGRSNPNFLVVGHHGAPNLAAENTINSFKAAMAVGANAIEADFCITGDDVIVAFHDSDPDSAVALARQAGGEGYAFLPFVPPVGSSWRRPVNQLTLAELRVHYGYRLADGGRDFDAAIPTFREVLDWCADEPDVRALYLDLKFGANEVAAAIQLLRELWGALADPSLPSLQGVDFYLLTIHPNIIEALKQERAALGANTLRVVLDFEEPGSLPATVGAGLRDVSVGLTPSFTWSSYKREIAEVVDAREARQIDSVLAWTFDRTTQLAELLYYSVDGIITNDPATLRRMWKETLE
jgi:glycerophosphoryl diester phosphodiesterase